MFTQRHFIKLAEVVAQTEAHFLHFDPLLRLASTPEEVIRFFKSYIVDMCLENSDEFDAKKFDKYIAKRIEEIKVEELGAVP